MNDLSCLDHVVGISESECVCFDTPDKPDDVDVSLSGYYLDNPSYGLPLSYPQAVADCSHNDVWQVALNARKNGIVQFVTDFNAALLTSKWTRKIQPYVGNVGSKNSNKAITNNGMFGMYIDPVRFRGTTLTINQITIFAEGNNGENVVVQVYKRSSLIEGETTPLIEVNGTLQNNQVIIGPGEVQRIDLIDRFGNADGVYIVVDDGGDGSIDFMPYDTSSAVNQSLGCSSCNKRSAQSISFNNWINVQGVNVVHVLDLLTADLKPNKTFGVSVNVSMNCSTSWICQPLDWLNDDWARVVAELICLYSNRMLIEYILASDMANVYTAVRSEELNEKLAWINGKIPERLSWAVENFPSNLSDCYSCRRSSRKASILV